MEKVFQIVVCRDPGIGLFVISEGCFRINKYSSIEVKVSDWAASSVTFAGEFSFATLHVQERMYSWR
jgi:hypothetical protein